MVIIDDACGRYTLHQRADDIAKRYNLTSIPDTVRPSYNVATGQIMPVITEDANSRYHLELMKWGLILSWAKDSSIATS
jgi:putative SOS response-associated peptidase YedK